MAPPTPARKRAMHHGNEAEKLRSKALRGVVCTFTGLTIEIRKELSMLIHEMGGTVTPGLDDTVTHLIADTCDNRSDKYVAARRKHLPVMLPTWIYQAKQTENLSHLADFTAEEVLEMYRTPIFAGCEITITGFTGNERVDIGHLIEMHGGVFTGQMSKRTCTHLIAVNDSGEKYRRAKEWGSVHVVTDKWLRKCIESEARLPEERFAVGVLSTKEEQLTGDEQPADENVQPTDENEQPADKDEQLTEDEQPADENEQPADKDEQLTEDEQPADENEQPADENEQPADKDEQPADENEQPADEDEQPANENEQPADKDKQPIENVQTVEDQQPAIKVVLIKDEPPAENENNQLAVDLIHQFLGYFNVSSGGTDSAKTKKDKPDALSHNRQQIALNQVESLPIRKPLNKAELVAERKLLLGSKCQTFCARNPFVGCRASMQYIFDEKANRFLDCTSNIQHVGHCHPQVVQAISTQLSLSACTNRFLSPVLTECAKALLHTLHSSLDTVLFCNSGSEANDLAMQLARDWSKTEEIVVLENAYHGHITTTVQMSSYKFEHGANIRQPEWVHVAQAPDVYRGKYRLADSELNNEEKLKEAGEHYANDVRKILEQIVAARHERGKENYKDNLTSEKATVAGFIAEALQSCGGQVIPPSGYYSAVADAVHAHGGLMIIDEVQTGIGRVGSTFWAHQLNDKDFVPDIVTMGEPMGNGFPVSAVVTRKEIGDKLSGKDEYFNTYGGNPVSCAAVLAVLDVIQREKLLAHSQKMGELFRRELNGLKERHECIGDVRGVGMFWGLDLVKCRQSREPATELAASLIMKLRQQSGVLLNADGPHGNILKFKPPLCFNKENLAEAVNALDKALIELREHELILSGFNL